jgi:uncharacterized protein (TIGR03437 family)
MHSGRLVVFVIAALVAIADARLARAQEYKLIYSWVGKTGIYEPGSPMTMDSQGNLYGTLAGGVFKLSPPSVAGGQWTEQVLIDSTGPSVRLPSHGLLFDAKGNLFGLSTTQGQVEGQYVSGYITEVSPPSTSGGAWTSEILYLFPDDPTQTTICEFPQSYLTMDSQGNLYGTCTNVGATNLGGVYKLSPPGQAGGQWTQQLLHAFANDGVDGNGPGPEAGLIFDAQGNLYGTTENGGSDNAGVVFELSPGAGGEWTETILYTFKFDGGPATPYGALVFDHQGNLYTTTTAGGVTATGGGAAGGVIELSPPANQGSEWTLTQVYGFKGKATDGAFPAAGVLFDAAGNIWGTTFHGGPYYSSGPANTDGVLFELMPQGGGGWKEVVRHFFGAPGDVFAVTYPLVIDSKGNVYGGGSGCNTNGCTGIFEYTNSAPALGPSIAASGLVNGASFASGGIVPGEIATVFGTGLTSSSGINLTSGLPLVTNFLNTSVMVDGTVAPLFAIDNVNGQEQINFQVPWEVSQESTATISVTSGGASSSTVEVPVLAAQPGIINYSAAGGNFGVILHSDYQLADSAHPVNAGETVLIYCTGLGAVSPTPTDGTAATGQSTIATPKVTIGGVNAPVSFSGLAPDFVGLNQVNVQIPSGLKAGNQPVVMTSGGVSSNSVLVPVG